MKIPLLIKKQLWVALYTSPAISSLAVTPMFILTKMELSYFPTALLFSSALVFIVWLINIGIYALAGNANWRYTVSALASILLAMGLIHQVFIPFHSWRFGSFSSGIHLHLIVFVAVDMVVVILQDLVVTREKKAAIEMENAQLRLRNAEAMNQQLMQQIQPHFLFNSLSTLKSLIGVSPERASEYLVRLSGFLRATLSSHTLSIVVVGKELDLCIDYLEMQRIRFGEALQFSVDVPAGVCETGYLPVFSLQLLIENAIKHNILTRERPLSIRVVYEDGWISVSNNLQPKQTGVESAGTGLVNLRERYRALTGDSVRIEQTDDRFSVYIKVFAYENSHH